MKYLGTLIIVLSLAACAWAQNGGGLHLVSQQVSAAPESLLDPAAAAWKSAVTTVALNRTPPTYASDPPSALEIPTAEVRLLRAGDALLVRLAWKDPSHDVAELGT